MSVHKNSACDDASEAVGKTDFDFFDKTHAREAYQDEQHILKTGSSIVGKIEEERKPDDPSKRQWASTTKMPLYDNNLNIIGTFGITDDVTERVEAQINLKESEQKYRSIFENIQDVYYRTDRDGFITEVSPSIEKYSGYKQDQIIGKPVTTFYQNQSDYDELIDKLRSDGIVADFEIRLANINKHIVYTSINANIIRNEHGKAIGVEGIMRDISTRKKAENSLQEAHNFYTQILSNTSQGIYVVDKHLRYTFWNRMMEKISGFSESYVIGKKPEDLFSHVDQNNIIDSIKKAISGEISRSGDYFYEIAETGKNGWVQAFYTPLTDNDGSIEGALVAISDITDRKAAEEKLREGDETLRKLSEQVPGSIYQYQQFPNGQSRFPFASKGFYHLFEMRPDDVKEDATKALQRIYRKDIEQVEKTINKSFHTLDNWEQDFRVLLPDRGLRWLRGKARPERQPDGSVIWHGYITDITDNKNKQNELNRTLDIVSDQNSRLMNFAHIVSHNLRNHAGTISSLLSLYESEESEETRVQLLTYLNLASKRLNEAISDLNEIIDKQAGTGTSIRRLNVYDYFKKVKEILSTDIINHNISFKVNIPDDTVINYNPSYLESILLNLISNAIKYRDPQRSPVITISLENVSGSPVLTVEDNGMGINLDKYGDMLFGMYNTFHDNENSKGIGLYITKNQVESMGGSIEVSSEEGRGTIFRVDLTCDLDNRTPQKESD